MATRVYYGKAVSGNNYVNNGGTIVLGGNVPAGAPITNVPSIANSLGYHSGKNGCVVASGDYTGAKWIYYSGDFATMTAGRYVIKGNCQYLAGQAYTGINSGANASGSHHSIHYTTTRRTTPIYSWSFDASGNFTFTYGASTTDDFIVSGSGSDDAATPTRAIPGELAYMVTGAAPTTDEYAARTTY